MSDEPSFRVIGDNHGAAIEVRGGMEPELVASGLKHCLLKVYAKAGTEMSESDLTLANIVMGEMSGHIRKMQKQERRNHWVTMALYLALGLNVGAALVNVLTATH